MSRVSNSQPGVDGQNGMFARELRKFCSPDDGPVPRDGGRRAKAERHGLMNTEGGVKPDVRVRSFVDRSSQSSHWSCIHIEVPLMFSSSTLFLDKSLVISLTELDDRTVEEPALFRSTLSVRLGVSSRNQPAKRGQGRGGQAASLGNQPGVQQTVPACSVTDRAFDSDPQRHGSPSGLLSFRRPEPSNTNTGGLKENADEFRREPLTSNLDPGMNFITSPQK